MNKLVRTSKLFLKRNSATILTCVGGVGVVATAVMAVKATPKALQVIEQATEEKGEELTKLEIVKVAGPSYIPAVLIGAATLTCIFGANTLNKRQQASIMSAYALLDKSYKEYRKKVEDLYGKEVDTHIKKKIAEDKYEEADIVVSDDTELFYDMFSERYFESTMADVLKAEYEINKKITQWGGAHLNEFYEWLDIEPVSGGETLGWSEGSMMAETWGKWLDFTHEKVVMDDGLECYIIEMSVDPTIDYEYY